MRVRKVLIVWLLLVLLSNPLRAERSNKDLIGMIVPLTGFVAEYGIAVQNGVQMYAEDHPQNCSNVTFEWEDGQYNGPKTITAFRKFLAEGAQLQYVWGSAPAEVVVPIAEKESMPLFVLAETETVAGKYFSFNWQDAPREIRQTSSCIQADPTR